MCVPGAMYAEKFFALQQVKFSIAASYPLAIDISAQMDNDQMRRFGKMRTRAPRVNVLDATGVANSLAVKVLECERNLGSGMLETLVRNFAAGGGI